MKTDIHAFTLIELSIVLVIIGLIVGGVLVGRDLIRASTERAQISQIERYHSAVNTFRGKFNALPGDMSAATAAQFGFTVGTGCDGTQGQRDGNGIIEAVTPNNYSQAVGETGLFWQDLSSQKLLDVTVPNGTISSVTCNGCPAVANTGLVQYLPRAVINDTNYVYAYGYNGSNWLGVSAINRIATCANPVNGLSIPVVQAFNIDSKIDDGFPASGNVQAQYIGQTYVQYAPNSATVANYHCFNSTTTNGMYAMNATVGDNANKPNCAISFRFQ